MRVETAPQSNGAQVLRRLLPYSIVGLFAAAILLRYNIVFAQDITFDETNLDQGTNLIWMVGAFLVFFMQAGFAFLGVGLISWFRQLLFD